MKNNYFDKVTIAWVVTLVLIVGLVCRGLLVNAVLTSDDYEHHVVRTANYYLALKQGQLPPRWAPNLNESLGYPTFVYTYHLPYAMATAFHAARFSLQESVNLSMLLLAVSGVVGMYWYARYHGLPHVLSGALGLVYVLNPYILLNIFWRGAFGEVAFYCLLPVVLLGVSQILTRKSGHQKSMFTPLVLAVGGSALLLSHLISVVILIPVLGVYVGLVILHTKHSGRWQKLNQLAIMSGLTLLLSAWYMVPALLEKSLIQFDDSKLSTLYSEQFLGVFDSFSLTRTLQSSEWFLEVIQVGPVFFVTLAVLAFFFAKKAIPKPTKVFAGYWFGVACISVALMWPVSQPVWDSLGVLRVMQFPWRFLWLTSVALAVLLVTVLPSFSRFQQHVVAMVLVGCAVWSALAYAQPKGYSSKSDYEWYESVMTGSSFDEFRPVGAQPSYTLSDRVIVEPLTAATDSSTVAIDSWNGTNMTYQLTTTQPSTVVQKTLYFPGWELTVDSNMSKIDSQNQEYPGLITYSVPSGEHQVKVSFSGSTPARTIGNILTGIGVGLLGMLLVRARK